MATELMMQMQNREKPGKKWVPYY